MLVFFRTRTILFEREYILDLEKRHLVSRIKHDLIHRGGDDDNAVFCTLICPTIFSNTREKSVTISVTVRDCLVKMLPLLRRMLMGALSIFPHLKDSLCVFCFFITEKNYPQIVSKHISHPNFAYIKHNYGNWLNLMPSLRVVYIHLKGFVHCT